MTSQAGRPIGTGRKQMSDQFAALAIETSSLLAHLLFTTSFASCGSSIFNSRPSCVSPRAGLKFQHGCTGHWQERPFFTQNVGGQSLILLHISQRDRMAAQM